MRIIHFCSLSLLFGLALLMSCLNENSGEPVCNGSLAVMVESKTNPTSCVTTNGSITVSALGGEEPYLYSLNGGAKQAAVTFSGLSPGSYSVTVFDANDCEHVIDNIGIEVPGANLGVTATPTSDTNCTTSNGSIVASGTGGNTSSPYQYALNEGAFTVSNTFTALAPGTYTVKVKDAGGCIATQSVNVLQGNTGVSYQSDIKPILEANCIKSGCHNGDNGATRNWSVFANVQAKAEGIKNRTANKSMPLDIAPTGLPQNQIDLIACWVNEGAQNN
jgi:uncharacterized protein (DUF2141 family)